MDSGIAAALMGLDERALAKLGGPFGALLENFVTMEIARQLSWNEEDVFLHHYRTRDKIEVDKLLENARGEVVAIEVKASSTVRGEDFRGLRHLSERLGDKFVVGVVFYTGPETLPFGPKLRAVPISALWESAPSVS